MYIVPFYRYNDESREKCFKENIIIKKNWILDPLWWLSQIYVPYLVLT